MRTQSSRSISELKVMDRKSFISNVPQKGKLGVRLCRSFIPQKRFVSSDGPIHMREVSLQRICQPPDVILSLIVQGGDLDLVCFICNLKEPFWLPVKARWPNKQWILWKFSRRHLLLHQTKKVLPGSNLISRSHCHRRTFCEVQSVTTIWQTLVEKKYSQKLCVQKLWWENMRKWMYSIY